MIVTIIWNFKLWIEYQVKAITIAHYMIPQSIYSSQHMCDFQMIINFSGVMIGGLEAYMQLEIPDFKYIGLNP
jgi:hypothetical protein